MDTPWSFNGGADDHVTLLTLVRPDETEQVLPSKVFYFNVKLGDKLVSYGECGGEYGDARLRQSDTINAYIADGLISANVVNKLFSQIEK